MHGPHRRPSRAALTRPPQHDETGDRILTSSCLAHEAAIPTCQTPSHLAPLAGRGRPAKRSEVGRVRGILRRSGRKYAPHPNPLPVRTGRGRTHHRVLAKQMASEFSKNLKPSAHRGRGECRVPIAPAASRGKKQNHTSLFTARTTGNHPAFPHANGFNGFLRALPGDRACCLRHLQDHLLASLTPASGRQNHTTSPSASSAFVFRTRSVHRIPHPTFVTIGQTPLLSGRDGARF
jgi:hypothetical protein